MDREIERERGMQRERVQRGKEGYIERGIQSMSFVKADQAFFVV